MSQHVFDMKEAATRNVIANQLHDLANQFAAGRIDLAYDEWAAPVDVQEPVNVVLDFTRNRHHASMVIDLRWATAAH
ncbi:MAG: amphi-Trp domain-containing protein [Thermoleophilia bacterium]|nr:amphi-Trp domain-containing protein [Thermoleophilia bacterium]